MKPSVLRPVFYMPLAVLMLMAFSSCHRAPSNTSSVSLELPTYNQASSVLGKPSSGAQVSQSVGSDLAVLCNPCLKSLAIRVDGSDFTAVEYSDLHSNVDENGTSVRSTIALEVPSGPGRRIQVLALYRTNSDSQNEAIYHMHYGQLKVDLLSPEPPPFVLQLANQGMFRQASIQGRYLTDQNGGPSGKIDIYYNHRGGLRLNLGKAEMLNGWFSAWASENFALTYHVSSMKRPFLSDVSTASLKNLILAKNSREVAHVTRPVSYYKEVIHPDIGAQVRHVKESRNLVVGFFGEGVSPNHTVCVEPGGISSPTPLSRLWDGPNQTSNNLVYTGKDAGSNANSIYVTGGTTSCGLDEKTYTSNKISLRASQFDDKGEDVARGIYGAFTAYYDMSQVQKLDSTGQPQYILKTLPELFGFDSTALFDGVKLYHKIGAVSSDASPQITCTEKELDRQGFTEVKNLNLAPELFATPENNVRFTLPTLLLLSSPQFAVCPTLQNQLRGYGGAYLGVLPYNHCTSGCVAGP